VNYTTATAPLSSALQFFPFRFKSQLSVSLFQWSKIDSIIV